MALTGGVLIGNQGQGATIKAEWAERIQFDLDAAYPTGGYTAFSTFVKTLIGTKKTIIDIKQANVAAGYKLWWDRVNDTLLVYQGAAGLGADSQVPNLTDLIAVTNVEMWVYSS